MVMKTPVEVSAEQVEKFHSKFHGDTNRPVQPVNARPVLKKVLFWDNEVARQGH